MAATSNLTSGTLANSIAVFYDKVYLKRLELETMLYKFGDKRPIPRGEGQVIHWTRYNAMGVSSLSGLSESVTPNETVISSSKISATISSYGAHVVYTDLFNWTAIDKGTKEQVSVLADLSHQKIEDLIQTELKNFTKQIVGGLANISLISSANIITTTEMKKAFRTLYTAGVPKHPLAGGKYALHVHPYCIYDLQADGSAGSWIDVAKRNDVTKLEEAKMGDLFGFRIWANPNVKYDISGITATSAFVYNNLAFGGNAFGVVEIGGAPKNPEIIIKELGSAGTDDPYNQRGTIAAKIMMTVKVLEAARGLVLQCGATNGSTEGT